MHAVIQRTYLPVSFFCGLFMLYIVVTSQGSFATRFPLTNEDVSSRSSKSVSCIKDCSQAKARPICGSDGRTFNSRCDLKNARCIGRRIRVRHKGPCPVEKSRCLTERAATQQLAETSTAGVFIPQCNPDGSYATVQCHVSFGYCWCVTEDGRPIPGSSVRNQRPLCNGEENIDTQRPNTQMPDEKSECSQEDRATFNTNLKNIFREEYDRLPADVVSNTATDILALIDEERKVIDWKFTDLDVNADSMLDKKELRDLRRLVKKIVKPKKCAKTLVSHCDMDKDEAIARTEWLFCLGVDNISFRLFLSLNSDEQPEEPTGNSDSREADPGPILTTKQVIITPQETESSNSAAASDESVVGPQSCEVERQKAIFEAERLPNSGVFIPQCKNDGSFKAVQCHDEAQYCWCVYVDTGRPIPGTSSKASNKEDCNPNALSGGTGDGRIFEGCSDETKEDFLETMIEWMTSQMMETLNIDTSHSDTWFGDRPTTFMSSHVSPQERVARWKFRQLDVDNNNLLEKAEIRPFKKTELKSVKAAKMCKRNFIDYCDADSNEDLSMGEWLKCLEVRQENPLLYKPSKGSNPFSEFQ
ncbi:SPARC-related modular calcium-binding protein 1-like isoform X2 [Amphiura filiformis]|uniref:SPARC-related modular calcium-binding protein 1-like isoform X2 n=1 Tax=Amphiura filiformis TaxID=82378 RepID=UPI003B2173F1